MALEPYTRFFPASFSSEKLRSDANLATKPYTLLAAFATRDLLLYSTVPEFLDQTTQVQDTKPPWTAPQTASAVLVAGLQRPFDAVRPRGFVYIIFLSLLLLRLCDKLSIPSQSCLQSL